MQPRVLLLALLVLALQCHCSATSLSSHAWDRRTAPVDDGPEYILRTGPELHESHEFDLNGPPLVLPSGHVFTFTSDEKQDSPWHLNISFATAGASGTSSIHALFRLHDHDNGASVQHSCSANYNITQHVKCSLCGGELCPPCEYKGPEGNCTLLAAAPGSAVASCALSGDNQGQGQVVLQLPAESSYFVLSSPASMGDGHSLILHRESETTLRQSVFCLNSGEGAWLNVAFRVERLGGHHSKEREVMIAAVAVSCVLIVLVCCGALYCRQRRKDQEEAQRYQLQGQYMNFQP